jgi:two-component system, LytTR family, response regulator
MNCIIIDEDIKNQELIKDYISKIPYLNLVATCSEAFQAFEILKKNTIDLIFLDIQLSQLNGIEFIESLEKKPLFIFITDSRDFAVESYELNATDYILKPVSFGRFIKGVNKAYDLFCLKNHISNVKGVAGSTSISTTAEKFLLVKTDYQTIRIDMDNILYIEGLKDYVKIFTSVSKPVITLNSLKNLSEKLPPDIFVRIHKSYIVSLSKIQSISRGRIVNIGDKVIPVGDVYKDSFNLLIGKHNITK